MSNSNAGIKSGKLCAVMSVPTSSKVVNFGLK